MSTVLIVGGDQIDGLKKIVSEYGHHDIEHWSGRKAGDHHKKIPQNTELVVLVTSWLNHSFTYAIKRAASKRHLKIVYATSLTHVREHLMKQLGQDSAVLSGCRKTLQPLMVV